MNSTSFKTCLISLDPKCTNTTKDINIMFRSFTYYFLPILIWISPLTVFLLAGMKVILVYQWIFKNQSVILERINEIVLGLLLMLVPVLCSTFHLTISPFQSQSFWSNCRSLSSKEHLYCCLLAVLISSDFCSNRNCFVVISHGQAQLLPFYPNFLF